jgi:hypothetical protein
MEDTSFTPIEVHWIDVHSRMPAYGIPVLVVAYSETKTLVKVGYLNMTTKEGHHWNTGDFMNKGVSHWMPMIPTP